jgi:hypothetical protein
MSYIRTDEIKKKQSVSMKKIHSENEYDWQSISEKRKLTLLSNNKKCGRKPGSGREKTGQHLPCPTCGIDVYHQKKYLESGKRKYCSRDCMYQSDLYINKLKNVDRSYTQTEQYKSVFRKESTPAYKKYRNKVDKLTEKTYVKYYDLINPNGYPRTIAGVDGGYQLDHIKPIHECFKEGVDPEKAASLENLRMLPWKQNLMRNWCDNIV